MPTSKTETEPEIVELPPPTNVIAALARVMAEIGGIRKLTAQQRQKLGMGGGDAQGITYAYRGIDQLAQAAQPLLGTYGVVIVPNVLNTSIDKIVKGNATMETTAWTRTTVEVEWTIYGPGYNSMINDKIVSITVGVGDDNVDKGVNKAMTAAFKNLLLRILCIGDPQDDTDGHGGNEPDNAPPIDPKLDAKTEKAQQVFEMLKAAKGTRLAPLLKQFAADNDKQLTIGALYDDAEWALKLEKAILEHIESAEHIEETVQIATTTEANASGEETPPKTKLGSASKPAKTVDEASAALQEQLGATEVK